MAELLDDDSAEASREERVFRNWINSLGLPNDVTSLYEDSKNGTKPPRLCVHWARRLNDDWCCCAGEMLLHVMERLVPNSVNWKMVKKGTKIQIKLVQNCNYVVEVAQAIGIKVMVEL